MKKNDWIFISSVAAYSYLFYLQSAGINFFIYSILLILLLVFRDKNVLKNKTWIVAAIGTLVSGFCILYYGNSLSVIANIISIMLLSALSFNSKTSVITSLLFSAYSIICSSVFMLIDVYERTQIKNENSSGRSVFIKVMVFGLPVFIGLVFFFLYKGANPMFDNLTQNINLNFISIDWVMFTILGSIFLYGIFYHRIIENIAMKDRSVKNSLDPHLINNTGWLARNFNIENEVLSGIVLLSLLNGLILIVNSLDINYLWFDGTLPKGLSYSSFVHQGTGMLIVSIIIAILIIMFYFRGNVNFYKNNKALKALVYLWIIQNVFMVISTGFRNYLYINEYSLTYKRIGVYVWLLLALIGLITTLIKIIKFKSNWFLFRINAWLFYGVLVISCIGNWDLIIANFNINRSIKMNRPLDKYYLLSLSDRTLPYLFQLNDSIKNEQIQEAYERQPGFISNDGAINDNFKAALDRHIINFTSMIDLRDWKSWNVSDAKAYEEIMKLNLQDKIIKK